MEEAMRQLIGEVFSGMEPHLRNMIQQEVDAALARSANQNYTKPYLTTEEACKYLSLSKNSLTNAMIEHGIKKRKIGSKNYYKTEDLNRILEA